MSNPGVAPLVATVAMTLAVQALTSMAMTVPVVLAPWTRAHGRREAP